MATDIAFDKTTKLALSAVSVSVLSDGQNRTPGGMAQDIVEIELAPLAGADFMVWRDLIRFSCEHGRAAHIIAALGLSVAP